MGIEMVLDMATSVVPDRVAIGRRESGLTYAQLDEVASGGASVLKERGAEHLVFVGVNGPILPVLTFASAKAGIPIAPLNYRLATEQLRDLVAQLDTPLIVADPAYKDKLEGAAEHLLTIDEFFDAARAAGPSDHLPADDDSAAVVLFTSGTTSAPKACCSGITT